MREPRPTRRPGVFRPALVIAGLAALTTLSSCSSGRAPGVSSPAAPASSDPVVASTTPPPSSTSQTSPGPVTSPSARPSARHSESAPPSSAATHPAARQSPVVVGHLPVAYTTGSARQVITVVAADRSRTTAVLQAWQRTDAGWQSVGRAVRANLGSQGSTTQPSESRSATPVGSFTLTRAFGHDADPGTRLPYRRTTPADWWISQPGAFYNTAQQCSSTCPFTQGDPNEHLYYETPAYDYAVVIDYNTANSPGGVKQGAGSAFFLHVSEGRATAGCVSIPASDLVRVMRWLDPRSNPRILIGA